MSLPRLSLVLLLLPGCAKPPAPVPLSVEPVPLPAELPAVDLDRGRYLVESVAVCSECHGTALTGHVFIDGFPMGHVSATNLTLLDHYTEADWLRAIRHGASPEGEAILLMPVAEYAKLTATDVRDMVAWLQTLEPAGEPAPPLELGPVGRALVKKGEWRYHGQHLDHSAPIPTAARDRGAYLAEVAGCMECHAGGVGRSFGPGQPRSSNLTPHADGLGDWSLADFERAMRTGQRPDGTTLDAMMPWRAYAAWPEEDIAAVWSFLQALPSQPTP